jgi:hypothetical protein
MGGLYRTALVVWSLSLTGCPFDGFMQKRLNKAERDDIRVFEVKDEPDSNCPKGTQAVGEDCHSGSSGARICRKFRCEVIH